MRPAIITSHGLDCTAQALVVRSDAFEALVHAAQGQLIFRDFLAGPVSLGG